MPFAHGKQVRVHIGHQDSAGDGAGDNFGFDVSPYMREASWSNPVDTADTSAFGTDAKTFVIGQYTSTLSTRGMFEDTAQVGLDAIVQPMIGVERPQILAIYPTGYTNLANPPTVAKRAAAGLGYVSGYDVSGSVGDMVSAALNMQGTGNVRTGPLLTDPRTLITATGNSWSTGSVFGYDYSASWSVDQKPTTAYLIVISNTMSTGTLVVSLEHSATANSGYATIPGLTFSTVTAGNGNPPLGCAAEFKLPTAGTTINRYVRAAWTVATAGTGGYKFAVILARQG